MRNANSIGRDEVNAVSETARPQSPQIVEDHIALQRARELIRRFAKTRNPRRARKPFVLPTKTPHAFAAHQPERFPHRLVAFCEGGQLAGRKAFGTLPIHGGELYAFEFRWSELRRNSPPPSLKRKMTLP